MQNLSTSLGFKTTVSAVSTARPNGTVESFCKGVLRVMCAFNSEAGTPEADWLITVQAIQSILNSSLSRRLSGRATISFHSRVASGNPLTVELSVSKIRNV